jgi:hypothetical protein
MDRPLLLQVLLSPRLVDALAPAQWDLLIRQARRANLIARLATALQDRLDAIPVAPRRHLQAALLIARRQGIAVRWEARCIRAALAPLGVRPILLKGAAYLLADLPGARGRLFGDVDVLVPKARIDSVQAGLIAAGWAFDDDLSAYDQRYYAAPPAARHGAGPAPHHPAADRAREGEHRGAVRRRPRTAGHAGPVRARTRDHVPAQRGPPLPRRRARQRPA